MEQTRYVLITAARNERAFLRNTIISVISQTILPQRWIIVSDGSKDGTDELVLDYSSTYDFIQLIRRDASHHYSGFSSKVFAIKEAYKIIGTIDYQYIGILDADVSFEADYYEKIISRLKTNKHLGIAGGVILEKEEEVFKVRKTNNERSVAGAIQTFKRECYEQIGGLTPIRLGGEDWIAETMARMRGWEVKAYSDCRVNHHKSGAKTRGLWQERLRLGLMDYALGTHPLFEVFKCIRRFKEKPLLVGALYRFCGFVLGCCNREKRPVSDDFVGFLRQEQLDRIRSQISIKAESTVEAIRKLVV